MKGKQAKLKYLNRPGEASISSLTKTPEFNAMVRYNKRMQPDAAKPRR